MPTEIEVFGNTFQSTPPVRGATIAKGEEEIAKLNFNPRPPCGGRPLPRAKKR